MKYAALITLVATLFSGACSSNAMLVRKDPNGGRVALQGAYMPAMAQARTLMAERCRGRFEAVEVGQSVAFRCRSTQPMAAELVTRIERARNW